MSQETVAAQDMIGRFTQWQGRESESVAADTTYGNGEFLQWLADRSITPYMRTRDSIHRKRSPFFGPERFTYYTVCFEFTEVALSNPLRHLGK